MLKTKLHDKWYAKKRDGRWYRQIPTEKGKLRYAERITNEKTVRRLERVAIAFLSKLPSVPKSYSSEIVLHGTRKLLSTTRQPYFFKLLLSPSREYHGCIDVKVDQFAGTKVHITMEPPELDRVIRRMTQARGKLAVGLRKLASQEQADSEKKSKERRRKV